MLDNSQQEKNRDAFYEFAKSVEHDDYDSAHVRMFDGYVEYRYNNAKNTILGQAKIRLSLRDYHYEGSIEIMGNEKFDANIIHLSSSPAFQCYTFNERSNEFIIQGQSPRIGNYEIIITPI